MGATRISEVYCWRSANYPGLVDTDAVPSAIVIDALQRQKVTRVRGLSIAPSAVPPSMAKQGYDRAFLLQLVLPEDYHAQYRFPPKEAHSHAKQP